MRWPAVLLKAKWQRSLVKGGRFRTASSASTTNDDDEPIRAPMQANTGFKLLPFDLKEHFLFTLSTSYSMNFRNINQIFPTLLKFHHFAEITLVDVSVYCPFDHAFLPSLLPHFGTLHSLRMNFTGGSQAAFPIEDAISLSMLHTPSSSLHSLQRLAFHNFAVTMP